MTFDAYVNMKGTDQASPVIDAATKNILANWKMMRAEVRSTTAQFQLQNQTLVAAQGVFRSFGSVAGSFMSIFTQFNTMQIRVTDANNSLILAQLHYNQVLAEEGPGTNDAIAASIQLQEAKQSVAQATQQETLGYIGMGLELGSTVSLMISAIPKIQQFIKQLGLAKTATAEAQAASTVTSTAASAGGGAATTAAAGASGAGVAGLATRLGKAALKIAPKAGIAAGGVELLSMMGQQQAGETSVPTGMDALSQIAGDVSNKLSDFGDRLSNFFEGKGFTPSNSDSGKVEHVVTIKIENPTDHRITATEKSMGIEQVMSSSGP